MSFNSSSIRSVEFGVCLDVDNGERYCIVPSDKSVQDALKEMFVSTIDEIRKGGNVLERFSPSEKYGSNERLFLPLDSDLALKYREVFATANFAIDTHGLNEPSRLICYFAIFRDGTGGKAIAFRRAAQFKGVVEKNFVTFMNDTLKMMPDRLFKLDQDYDFLIMDQKIYIWRPSGFIFTAGMDEQIAACAMKSVEFVAKEIRCVNFDRLKEYVSKHKMAMRLIAAIRSRDDLADISKKHLKSECKEAGLKVYEENGVLFPEEGNEFGFLMLLDRRRYTVTLIDKKPETYEAPSRHIAQRAE